MRCTTQQQPQRRATQRNKAQRFYQLQRSTGRFSSILIIIKIARRLHIFNSTEKRRVSMNSEQVDEFIHYKQRSFFSRVQFLGPANIGGSDYDGSFLAANIENEDSNATFEKIGTIFLYVAFGSAQHRQTNDFSRFLLSPVICPRTETSIEK